MYISKVEWVVINSIHNEQEIQAKDYMNGWTWLDYEKEKREKKWVKDRYYTKKKTFYTM